MPTRSAPASRSAHWEHVYETKQEDQLSWHQDEPSFSLALIQRHASAGGRVIDIGGGTSLLAGRLVAAGYRVNVVDISAAALRRARERSGPLAEQEVDWVRGDVADVALALPPCDLWHDRAVLHFLTWTTRRAADTSSA